MTAVSRIGPLQARLRKARLALGHTQVEMNQVLGLGRHAWHYYETGKKQPGARVFTALVAHAIDVNWLLAQSPILTGSPLATARTLEVDSQLADAITYCILRTQACARNGNGVALTAETIADYSGELLDTTAALASALRLSQAGVAAQLPPTRGAPLLVFYLPALRTINDYELALKSSADTLREILSWPMT